MRAMRVAASGIGVALSVLLWSGVTASAATPQVTTIQDQLFRADGTPVNGTLLISWKAFVAADNSNIPANALRVPVSGGLLRVKLVPTTTAQAGASYMVVYLVDGKVTNTEVWSVPPSTAPLAVKMVRTSATTNGSAPAADTVLQIADIVGLSDALSERPARGGGYLAGRLLVPDTNGDLSGLDGSPDQCVRGDGSLGPCGSNPVFVDLETPNGNMDGSNATFTLGTTPSPATSLQLFRNGLLQKAGLDFTLTGPSISFQPGSVPQPGDLLQASYRVTQ